MIKRIFSGIQPTGVAHIGNYLGAIKQWVSLQNAAIQKNDVMFCVVDMHSCTTCHDRNVMNDNLFKMVASLLACGIDPKKSLMFQQSKVPFHSELAWYLGCIASTGQLKRMHQWKSKKNKDRDENNLGLFSYPVLMAADILLYKATHVPVGDDQMQHIELARDLAVMFNKRYKFDFPLPQGILTSTSRIMSLTNPNEKMSKSNLKENSRIDLNDQPDVIHRKIIKAVTDSLPYLTEDFSDREGVKNLLELYMACNEQITVKQLLLRYENKQYFTKLLKEDLSNLVIETLAPVRKEYEKLLQDKGHLKRILQEGSSEAFNIAVENMRSIHKSIGFR